MDPAACGQPCLLLVRRQRLADSVSGCGRSGDLHLDGGDGTGGKSRKAGLPDRGGARRRSVPHRCACAAQVSEIRHAAGGWHGPGAGCAARPLLLHLHAGRLRDGCLQRHRGAAEEPGKTAAVRDVFSDDGLGADSDVPRDGRGAVQTAPAGLPDGDARPAEDGLGLFQEAGDLRAGGCAGKHHFSGVWPVSREPTSGSVP